MKKKVWKKSFSKKEFFWYIYLMLLFCRIIDGKVECDAQGLMVELESRFLWIIIRWFVSGVSVEKKNRR